jgi:hypothetical protein
LPTSTCSSLNCPLLVATDVSLVARLRLDQLALRHCAGLRQKQRKFVDNVAPTAGRRSSAANPALRGTVGRLWLGAVCIPSAPGHGGSRRFPHRSRVGGGTWLAIGSVATDPPSRVAGPPIPTVAKMWCLDLAASRLGCSKPTDHSGSLARQIRSQLALRPLNFGSGPTVPGLGGCDGQPTRSGVPRPFTSNRDRGTSVAGKKWRGPGLRSRWRIHRTNSPVWVSGLMAIPRR